MNENIDFDCNKCKWYYRLVNHKGKSMGYVCGMWLEGISDAEGGVPSQRCYTPRKEEAHGRKNK